MIIERRPLLFGLAALFALGACGDDESVNGTNGINGANGTNGIGGSPRYAHLAPPTIDAPLIHSPATWVDHLQDDLLPYWRMEDARGDPVGNFPTYRTMTGRVATPTDRRPRMLSRQTYAYSMGYLLTGDPELLRLARAGAAWLLDHAPDAEDGGYHAVLRDDGSGAGDDPKTAQDTAYVMLGLGAYYFVTRDPAVEAELLRGRDLLFDPNTYWDEENQRIVDALSDDLSTEIDWAGEGQSPDGGWEVVAQLDPINAFMLLVQPVLSEAERREQFLSDLERLSQTLVDHFFEDGLFWGAHNVRRYGTRHVDFGHSLKAYWMILQVDKRLEASPFFDLIADNVTAQVARALDEERGRWKKRPTSPTDDELGSDWWIYAEADQIAATLTMGGDDFADALEDTAAHWISDYVDDRPAGEVISGINANGAPVFNWSDNDTAKCFHWKNGYHSVEHALVMYLFSSWRSDVPAELYFAVPADQADDFVARPYFYLGREVDRERLEAVDVGGRSLERVRVRFADLY